MNPRLTRGLKMGMIGTAISLIFLFGSYAWLPNVTPKFWWGLFVIPAFPTVFATYAAGMSGVDPYSAAVIRTEMIGVVCTFAAYFLIGFFSGRTSR